MRNLYYAFTGILALIWLVAISYYLYTTGDLLLGLMIVAFIVMSYWIVAKTQTSNL